MYLLQSLRNFDWRNLLLGEEEWSFLPEVLLRSVIMFLITLVALRLIGKRGIMQGVFEIVTIITLGSADPGLYSCSYCGNTKEIDVTEKHVCHVCHETKRVRSINRKRVK